jgi:glycosyltransferase involved in cell wall biosynthesis
MVTSEFPPRSAGTGNYVHKISRRLVEKGRQVTVITRRSLKNTRRQAVDVMSVLRSPFILASFDVSIHGLFVNILVRRLKSDLTLAHSHIPFPTSIKTSLPRTVHIPAYHNLGINVVGLAGTDEQRAKSCAKKFKVKRNREAEST